MVSGGKGKIRNGLGSTLVVPFPGFFDLAPDHKNEDKLD